MKKNMIFSLQELWVLIRAIYQENQKKQSRKRKKRRRRQVRTTITMSSKRLSMNSGKIVCLEPLLNLGITSKKVRSTISSLKVVKLSLALSSKVVPKKMKR